MEEIKPKETVLSKIGTSQNQRIVAYLYSVGWIRKNVWTTSLVRKRFISYV